MCFPAGGGPRRALYLGHETRSSEKGRTIRGAAAASDVHRRGPRPQLRRPTRRRADRSASGLGPRSRVESTGAHARRPAGRATTESTETVGATSAFATPARTRQRVRRRRACWIVGADDPCTMRAAGAVRRPRAAGRTCERPRRRERASTAFRRRRPRTLRRAGRRKVCSEMGVRRPAHDTGRRNKSPAAGAGS